MTDTHKKGTAVTTIDHPPVTLPDVLETSSSMLVELTDAMGVPRSVLAPDDQIEHAWTQLPRLLKRIPPNLRDKRVVKGCVATACGLFDASINYFWNAAIAELRAKVRRFGLAVVPQILDDKDFDEGSLLELKDAELLDLCLKLNLISDEDFFFLDQCRAMRNSFSAAHPADAEVDDDELLTFVSRCQKHALSASKNPKGVDTKALLSAIKGARFKSTQLDEWRARIAATFDAQRELIFVMLHGIYCDPDSSEEARINAISICKNFADEFTPRVKSLLVDRHQEYRAKGDEKRHLASTGFFERIGMLSLLGDAELHRVVTAAAQKLLSVHNAWDNFYNEPPFAERLAKVTRDINVPETARPQYVETVVACGMGNGYGVSNAAISYYKKMVKSFSPGEVRTMLDLPVKSPLISSRLISSSNEKRFRELVALIDEKTVASSAKALYKKWLPK